jgi:hypothetical protein
MSSNIITRLDRSINVTNAVTVTNGLVTNAVTVTNGLVTNAVTVTNGLVTNAVTVTNTDAVSIRQTPRPQEPRGKQRPPCLANRSRARRDLPTLNPN